MDAKFKTNHTDSKAEERNNKRIRFFDSKVKNACWEKAKLVQGRHPERWRLDAAGNVVCRKFTGCTGCLCYEYDHIVPFSKGGETSVENCQILQSRVNRMKSDKEEVDENVMQQHSCDIKLTYKEMDLVEMAVYGDVIRPGLLCKVKSMYEKLGLNGKKTKSSSFIACELPYSDSNMDEK